MRAWAFILGGLIVWTVQFFGLYAIASIFPGLTVARVLAIALTLAAILANIWLFRRAARILKADGPEEVNRWKAIMAALTAATSLVAVLWQGLPAVLD